MMDGGIGVEKFVRYHLKAVIACHGFANQMLQNRSAGGLIGVVLYPFHIHHYAIDAPSRTKSVMEPRCPLYPQ